MRTGETGNHDAWYLAEHLDRVARLYEDALEQLAEALGPKEGKVCSGSYCEKGLICANVGCGLLPTNVLFPGLKDHAERSLLSVEGCCHANQSAWKLAYQVLSSASDDSQSRSTEVHLGRYRLPLGYHDIRPILSRRLQSTKRYWVKAYY